MMQYCGLENEQFELEKQNSTIRYFGVLLSIVLI